MSSLHRSIVRLGEEIAAHYAGSYTAATPPYIVYVYDPHEEYRVRRDLDDLKAWLQVRNVTPVAISLATLFWQAVDESGFWEQIVAEEQRSPGDAGVLGNVHIAIGQILHGPPTLADRVIRALGEPAERSVAFLCRAGSLYPAFRTSALLDDLRERVTLPVVLLYPGRVEGLYGLRFMGRCEPAHGYRATIIARENG